MVGIVAVMVTSFQRTHVSIARLPGLLYSVPRPCSRWLSTHASAGDSWTLTGKSGSLSSGVTAPFSWVLMHTRFCCVLPESVSASWGSSIIKSHWSSKSDSLGVLPLLDPQVWKSVVGPRMSATVQELLWYNCAPVCGSSVAALLWG